MQVPGDNSVDLFTNDLGVVVICDAAGNLQGANIYAGGGMGRTHRNNDTAAMLVRLLPRPPLPRSLLLLLRRTGVSAALRRLA